MKLRLTVACPLLACALASFAACNSESNPVDGEPSLDGGGTSGAPGSDGSTPPPGTPGADGGADAGPAPFVPNRIIPVGLGSGQLEVDGATMGLECNDQLVVKGGSYEWITFKNIQAADGCIVMIVNDGLVEIAGTNRMTVENTRNVTLSGNGTAGIDKGFYLHDNDYRAFDLIPPADGFTLQYFSFKNVKDYVIHFDNSDQIYDGTEGSFTKNLKFLHTDVENTSSFINGSGSVDNTQSEDIVALVQNLEIAYLDVKHCPGIAAVAWFGNVDGYDIHHNTIDDINTENSNHNGIFSITGSGSFHHNRISNHQGNAIRAWTRSLGTTPKDVLIHDNIVVNSRKYSGFEVQSFDTFLIDGKTTFANAKIFNNTCGNLNTNNDWVGVVADVYGLRGGTAEVFNNLGFQLRAQGSEDFDFVTSQQGATEIIQSNNLRKETYGEVGILDLNEFRLSPTSPAKGAGKPTTLSSTDFYGAPRGATPSIGAVE